MRTLSEIYLDWAVVNTDTCKEWGGDKGNLHSYIEQYERLLAPYRHSSTFMEIGLAEGASVGMWNEYFGPECRLIGVDKELTFDINQFPRWKFIKADATKPGFSHMMDGYTLDVVIDDASHNINDQVTTRNMLMPLMNPGGLYIIEDILSLEDSRKHFDGAKIIDLRSKKNRFDDVLVIYHT